MDTLQINECLSQYSKHFIGTFALDQIPKFKLRPAAIVVNTQPASQSGEHWVALVLNKDGSGEYFDSFGLPAQEEMRNFLNTNCATWTFSSRTLQHPLSVTCGIFCCLFVEYRLRGGSYHAFLHLFGQDLEQNEEIAAKRFAALQSSDANC